LSADDWLEAAQIIYRSAKRDPINNAILPLIGLTGIGALVYYVPAAWPWVKMAFCHDLC
jgi:hypothetical protein